MKNLIVVIEPTRSIYWKWQGRVDGRVTEIHLGQFPAMSVEDARRAARALTDERDTAKMNAQLLKPPSFRVVTRPAPARLPATAGSDQTGRDCNWLWNEYMSRDGGGKPGSAEKQRSWNKDIAPFIGDKPYGLITYDDLAEIIAAKAENAPGAANHLVAYIKRLFRWSVTSGRPFTRLAIDPATDLALVAEYKEGDRHLNGDEVLLFFKTANALPGSFSDGLIHLLYTGVRLSEGFEMPWAEYNENTGHWDIPGSRTKNGDPLLLPLPRTLQEMLKERKKLCGGGLYVFRAIRADKPITGFSKMMNNFRAKMIEIASHDAGKPVEIPSWSAHDLRRTVETGMTGLLDENDQSLITLNVIDRILNHRQGRVRRTYNKHQFLAEKRRALALWADHLDGLRDRAVLPITKRAA